MLDRPEVSVKEYASKCLERLATLVQVTRAAPPRLACSAGNAALQARHHPQRGRYGGCERRGARGPALPWPGARCAATLGQRTVYHTGGYTVRCTAPLLRRSLGFGRIVVSETEVPNMLTNMV